MAAITSDEAAAAEAVDEADEAVAIEKYLDQRHTLWVTAAIGKVRSAIAAVNATDGAFTAEQQRILEDVLEDVLEGEDSSVPTPPKVPSGFVSEFRF